MITTLLALTVTLMLCFPRTPLAKWLHFQMVANPLDQLSKLRREHILYIFVGLILIQSYGAVLPIEIATAMAWEATLYFDAAISVWMAGMVAKSKANWFALKARIRSIGAILLSRKPASRRKRTPTQSSRHKPSNDNEDNHRWRVAA